MQRQPDNQTNNTGCEQSCHEADGASCEGIAIERNRFFLGKAMGPRDFDCDPDYFLSRHRLHNRLLHGWGIVCGLDVVPHSDENCKKEYVIVQSGVALDRYGREVILCQTQAVKLPPDVHRYSVLICLRYSERKVELVPVFYNEAPCGSNDSDYNRIREEATVVARYLNQLPGCWPARQSFWLLHTDDITYPDSLIGILRDKDTPLAEYLYSTFPPELQRELDGCTKNGPGDERSLLLGQIICQLNVLLLGENLHHEGRFEGIKLNPETQNLLSGQPTSDDLVRLNRYLLADAYKKEIKRNPARSHQCEDAPCAPCLKPGEHPCNDLVPLALVTRSEAGEVTIDMCGRRDLKARPLCLTHIAKINWPHGGKLTLKDLRDKGGLKVTFSRKLAPNPADGDGTGINQHTFIVQTMPQIGQLDHRKREPIALTFVHSDSEYPRLEDDGYVATFKIDNDELTGTNNISGNTVYITLKCDFIVDCLGYPVAGQYRLDPISNHLNLPSVAGGVFESWFTIDEQPGLPYNEED
ncbi:MAG TPA: hypothetical protein VGB67_16870 [Fibrella sp.]|jgi:hypothetical protein